MIHGATPVFVGASSANWDSKQVLLQIVPISIVLPNGLTEDTYALLDAGSQTSLILESLANEIGLDGEISELTIGTINSATTKKSKKVSFIVRSRGDDNHEPTIMSLQELMKHGQLTSSTSRYNG